MTFIRAAGILFVIAVVAGVVFAIGIPVTQNDSPAKIAPRRDVVPAS